MNKLLKDTRLICIVVVLFIILAIISESCAANKDISPIATNKTDPASKFNPTNLTSATDNQIISVYMPNPTVLAYPNNSQTVSNYLPPNPGSLTNTITNNSSGYYYTLNNYLNIGSFGSLDLSYIGSQTNILSFCNGPSLSNGIAGLYNIDNAGGNFNPSNGDHINIIASHGFGNINPTGIIQKDANNNLTVQITNPGNGYIPGEKVSLADTTRTLSANGSAYVECGYASVPSSIEANSDFSAYAYIVICNTGIYPINGLKLSNIKYPANLINPTLTIKYHDNNISPLVPNAISLLIFTLSGKAPIYATTIDLSQLTCTLTPN